MISLIASLIQLTWTIIACAISLAWMIVCTVVWLVWGLFFGFTIGPRPVNMGPFRVE